MCFWPCPRTSSRTSQKPVRFPMDACPKLPLAVAGLCNSGGDVATEDVKGKRPGDERGRGSTDWETPGLGQILFEHSRATTIRFCVPNPLFRFFHNTMLIVSCIVKGVLCLAMEFFEIAYVETFGITCYGKKSKTVTTASERDLPSIVPARWWPLFPPLLYIDPLFLCNFYFLYVYISKKSPCPSPDLFWSENQTLGTIPCGPQACQERRVLGTTGLAKLWEPKLQKVISWTTFWASISGALRLPFWERYCFHFGSVTASILGALRLHFGVHYFGMFSLNWFFSTNPQKINNAQAKNKLNRNCFGWGFLMRP